MINETQVKLYCCEDLSLIENYPEAAADAKMWECHHRAETDEKLTYKELKAQGRYWNRPASELIFLTRSAHRKLHYDAGTYENQQKAVSKIAAAMGRKNSKKVLQFTLDGTFVREWPSTHEIERQLKFKQTNICACCNGKHKSAYGFIWCYSSAVPGVHS